MPNISAVIVTHNSQEVIGPGLDYLFAQDLLPFEVIIVDNASQDHTREIIKKNYPKIKLIENPGNLGFSQAYNQAIKEAGGDFIFVLNDDVKLEDGFLANIYAVIKSNERIGAVQPKVLKPGGKIIDTTGIKLSWLRRFYNLGNAKPDGQEFSRERFIFGASAAAVLYRKKALEDIRQKGEYFDEDFFCIAEGIDLSWRLQNKGWRTLYCPQASCIHRGGISRQRGDFAQYLSMRNRYLLLLKNESFLGWLRFPLVILIYDLWRNLYMLAVNPGYFFKASFEVLILAPKMLQKRFLNTSQ